MHDSLRDVLFDAELVRKKWGVAPSQMVDLQALVGDAADNVPGVAGIGQKGAVQLLEEHGTLEGIFAKLASDPGSFKPRTRASLEAGIDAARLSRELVLLDRHAALPVALADLTIPEPDPRVVNDALKALEFYSLLSHQETAAAKAEQRAEGRSEFLQFAEIDALKEHLAAAPTRQPIALLGVWEGRARAGKLAGLGVCVAVDVPEDSTDAPSPAPLWVPARQIEALRDWLEDADAPKIVHDGRQLALALRDFSQGITLRGIDFDTQLASFLVDPNLLINEHHDLHAVVKEYLHRTLPALKDLTGGGKAQKSVETLEESSLARLVAEHVHAVRALEPVLRPLLVERAQGGVYRDVELPLGPVLAQMEYDGIGVDLQELARIGDELIAQRSALTTVIHGLAGRSFNIGSPKQLGEVLFEELKLPIVKRTKSGYSTDAEVLEKLAPKPLSRLGNADPKTHPIATEILRYRLVDKLINTYTDVLQRSVDPRTGRVHCTFQQTVGVTGRLITTDPDLQRTPVKTDEGKRIRDAFVAQPLADGTATCIVDADWSQIELRLLAHLSGDPLLVDAFVNHADVHMRTAAQIFKKPLADVDKREREIGKTVNFSTIYGQGATALGQLLGVSRKEASDYIAGYFAAYAGVKTWVAEMIARADRLGYAETLLGRRRIIPDLASQSPMTRSFGERVAANTPVQGSAADLCKLAMLHIAAKLPAVSPRGRMVLQVHDELLFEVPESDAVAVAAMVKHEMEHVLELRVPLVAEVRIGKSWGAAKAAIAV
jgi:DNA polymerase-1